MFDFLSLKKFKNKKIKNKFKEDIEPQEILLDYLAKKKEEELGIEEKRFETPLSKSLLYGFFIFIFILISFLFFKTFQLQAIEGEKFSELSKKNKFKIYQIQAERGIIYDKNGNQLVYNQSVFDLYLDTRKLPNSEEEKLKIFKQISSILNKNIEDLKKEIENSESFEVLIHKNLDQLSLILIEAKIDSGEFPGFWIEKGFNRIYNPHFSHLIGYTGKISSEELKKEPDVYSIFDWVGKLGIEKSYENFLRRDPGKLQQEKDVLGNLISEKIIKLPEAGKSLILYLDAELQIKIKEELEKQLKIYEADGAAAVAIDPKTGGILSLVSLPDFDNNLFQKTSDKNLLTMVLNDSKKPLLNRVIAGLYSTGSIIKPLIAAAALEEKIISPEKNINCEGKINVKHRYDPQIVYYYHDWKIHGLVNLKKAIAESCNVYFYTIGGGYNNQEGLGPTRIKNYLEKFGWAEKSQIDLPGEKEGLIPTPEWKKNVKNENWYDGDTYHISIGQGDILVTPLQVAVSFVAIANGGKLLKPRIVHKIIDKEKNIIEEFKPEIIREDFIKAENIEIVKEGMRQTVSSPLGTAYYYLNSLPVTAACKTGTAQTGKKDYYHNWITVFAPYEDPQIVLTIFFENVKTKQILALNSAKEILSWYFSPEKQ